MTEHVVQLAGGTCFTAAADEKLLAAAQRAHWLVRYGCRNGNCQACAVTLLAGSVSQDGTTVTATPAAPSTVLLCLCRAQSDLQIALPGDPLHGSNEQARRYYARLNSVTYGTLGRDGAAAALHLTLPAGRNMPVYPGQYFQLERHGESLRAEIDTTVSTGRDIYLQCATAEDFATDRYLTAIGPLGYCYARPATASVLILRDTPHDVQARLLQVALPDAQLCDAKHIAEHIAGASFDTVLACANDPRLTEQWYHALLAHDVVFDEFRTDSAIRYRWCVWRQDDNANRFMVDAGLDEPAARRQADDYQQRGHKQLYWAEPMTPRDRR